MSPQSVEKLNSFNGKLNEINNNNDKCLNSENLQKPYKVEIVWRNVVGMLVLHIAAVYGLILGITGHGNWKVYAYMVAMNYMCGFSILAGAHRLWSHKTYKANFGLRFVLAIFQTMSVQNDIYEWCRDHRVHHKYSETDADPHNASRGFFFAHVGWLLCKKHPDVKEKGKTVDMSDLWLDPIVRYQRRFYIPLVIFFRGLVFSGIPMYFFPNISLAAGICGNALCYVVNLHHTWLVNSAAHIYGTRPYDKNIGPTENRRVIFLTLGEGYHNYHHTFPYDYSASEFSWCDNFNPATGFIDFCAHMGWAWDRKKPSKETIEKRIQRTGDSSLILGKRENAYFWYDMLIGQCIVFWPLIIIYTLMPFCT